MHFKSERQDADTINTPADLYSNPVPIYFDMCTYIHVFVTYICMLCTFLITYINEKTYPKTFSDLNVFIAHDVFIYYTIYIYLRPFRVECRFLYTLYLKYCDVLIYIPHIT